MDPPKTIFGASQCAIIWVTASLRLGYVSFNHSKSLLFVAGGLLICLPREQAAAYCKDIEKQEGYQAWIIGIVEKGNRTARIIDKPRIIEVPTKEKDGELW